MVDRDDKRLLNATICFKDFIVDKTAIEAVTDCLVEIASGGSFGTVIKKSPSPKKGTCDNGNVRKNQSKKRNN